MSLRLSLSFERGVVTQMYTHRAASTPRGVLGQLPLPQNSAAAAILALALLAVGAQLWTSPGRAELLWATRRGGIPHRDGNELVFGPNGRDHWYERDWLRDRRTGGRRSAPLSQLRAQVLRGAQGTRHSGAPLLANELKKAQSLAAAMLQLKKNHAYVQKELQSPWRQDKKELQEKDKMLTQQMSKLEGAMQAMKKEHFESSPNHSRQQKRNQGGQSFDWETGARTVLKPPKTLTPAKARWELARLAEVYQEGILDSANYQDARAKIVAKENLPGGSLQEARTPRASPAGLVAHSRPEAKTRPRRSLSHPPIGSAAYTKAEVTRALGTNAVFMPGGIDADSEERDLEASK